MLPLNDKAQEKAVGFRCSQEDWQEYMMRAKRERRSVSNWIRRVLADEINRTKSAAREER